MASKEVQRLLELKAKRDSEFKQKKKLYYTRRKLKKSNPDIKMDFDFNKILSEEVFNAQMRKIAKMQKAHLDSNQSVIADNIKKYKEQKSRYYQENKQERLKYDAKYREKNKKQLQEYRKSYYIKKKQKQENISKDEYNLKVDDG